MNWFTSDEHYNHANIINKFIFRPFKNTEEMNSEIIRRHNSRVKNNDTVYHLGDFKFSSDGPNVYELIQQLNGRHVFIRGNHDKNNGLNSCLQYAVIQLYSQDVLLIHRPEDAMEIMFKTGIKMAFCGHVHEKWKMMKKDDTIFINVGVDQWDFYPIDSKQIFKAIKKAGFSPA